MNSENDIKVSNLSKSYDGKNLVLSDVSFSINQGDKVALIGANGSGKSTLMKCLIRIENFSSGNIEIKGRNINKLNRSELRKLRSQIGFVFQQHNLSPRLSVLTNVLHGVQSRKSGPRTWFQSIASEEDRKEALECLKQVGLEDFASRRAEQLSGGQSQRVAIARALMQRPKILLADEPVASLDPHAGEEVMKIFHQLCCDRGITLLFCTHHLDHARSFSSRVIGLKHGKLEVDIPASQANPDQLDGFYVVNSKGAA
ncbi:MAG: phosphonate ABC transporter ATP-binding protein [Bdellovibrionales bacterium]|nr:phosphonate ABC transporter ATP-binding protein [Bdellovibrionales bacterium]